MNAAVIFPATCRPASDVVLASAMFTVRSWLAGDKLAEVLQNLKRWRVNRGFQTIRRVTDVYSVYFPSVSAGNVTLAMGISRHSANLS